MKNQIVSFLLVLILVAGASCESLTGNSGGRTVVEGQVVERTTGQPVPDAYVQLYKPGKGMSSGYSKEGDPHRADANGKFSFSYDAADESSYLLMADSDKGHYTLWQEAPNLSSGRKNKDVKVKVQSPAWVKIKLIDELPKTRIWISIWGYDGTGAVLSLPKDTVFIKSTSANFPGRVSWDITDEQAVKTRYFKDFTVGGFDTATVEIRF